MVWVKLRNGEVDEKDCGMVAWQMGGGQDIQKGSVELHCCTEEYYKK